jgi:hypothetical protein
MVTSVFPQRSPSAERSFLDALESFEEAIQRANWPSALVDRLMGEIDAIYAELSKPHPSLTVLQEKGRSMRNTLEEVTAWIEAPNVIAAAQALWSAIGLAETS